MKGKIIIIALLVLGILLSGCSEQQKKTAAYGMVNSIKNAYSFEADIKYVNSDIVQEGHIKWLAPKQFYAECTTQEQSTWSCPFQMKVGDILITDGATEYIYDSSENKCHTQTPGDFTKYVTNGLAYKAQIVTLVDLALLMGNFNYLGITTINGEQTAGVMFSQTSKPNYPNAQTHTTEYSFYIRLSDYLPIKVENKVYTNNQVTYSTSITTKNLKSNTLTATDFNPQTVLNCTWE